MAIKFKAKSAQPESLVEALEIELGGKIYKVVNISARMHVKIQEFFKTLRDKTLIREKEIRDLGGDPEKVLEQEKSDYRKHKASKEGIDPKDVNTDHMSLGEPTMNDIASFIGAIVGEDPENLLELNAGELQECSDFLIEHLNDFLEYRSEQPEVKK